MSLQFSGLLIRQERMKRNWSQTGLCKGICAVSYLSKIEQGKIRPSREILRQLFERLEICWADEQASEAVQQLIERGYTAIFSMNCCEAKEVQAQLDAVWEDCANGSYMLDAILLRTWFTTQANPLADDFHLTMDLRQRTLWLATLGRYEEALRLNPIAFCYALAGRDACDRGNYVLALGHLQHGYDLAAKEGMVYVMLECSSQIGNCYSAMVAFEEMTAQYHIARRLAQAVGNQKKLEIIDYNIASTQIETGEIEQAYVFFSALESPSAGALHKLAICCELLEKKKEALSALTRMERAQAEYPDRAFWIQCGALVRYRLEHPGYLQHAAYGKLLLASFAYMQAELPSGYAGFHLPWVLAWYRANRQYKQAFELLNDFPAYALLGRIKD